MEFTVDDRSLYVMQTNPGRRTARAGVHIAIAMVHEQLINQREALLRVDADQMDYFQDQVIDPTHGACIACTLFLWFMS